VTARLLQPVRRIETYRALIFYVAELGLGLAGFTLLVAGWPVTLALAITPLVVPLLIGLRGGVGLFARAEAALARDLLGTRTRTPVTSPAAGFWNRGFAVMRDQAFWKQQAHLLLAWPIALVPLALLYWALELITLPIWYRWVDSADAVGFFEVDRFVETLPFVALGLALLVGVAHLLGLMARLSRKLATLLLGTDARAGFSPVRSAGETRQLRLRALTITSLVATSVVVFLILIWALTTPDGYFWPIWPLLSLSLAVGIPGAVMLVLEHPAPARLAGGSKALAIQVVVSAVLLGFLVAVWAVTTHGYFWPKWPALGLALAAAVHAAVVYASHHHRIEILEASRAGAVDAQETELRRIERDLHDGAQARLVALGMSLGMAEQHLGTDPEAVRELIAEARVGASEALEELRDLARGIHPPILTDRGLEAALGALVARSPVPVSLDVDVPTRPAPAVETAAYFTVSEALANSIKHAGAARVDIRIVAVDGTLLAEVSDDGRGGADASGRGLHGLRRRLAALDGTLSVSSPEGGPTIVRAELPCGS
jgi:signal transduction histidine kinase